MRNLSVCHAEKCDCCFREAYNQYCGSMLCYMDICIAPLTEGYSEVLSAWQAGEKKSLHFAWQADENKSLQTM